MNDTKIEWTDATWNPLRGCSRVSEGCRNCYAERVAARFSGPGLPYEGLATMYRGPMDAPHLKAEPRWTGQLQRVDAAMDAPLRWRRPRRIFVNSMSDLFHEKASDDLIDEIFGIMALCPQHTFQILTKRPERMRDYLGDGRYFSERRIKVWNARLQYRGKPVAPMPWPLANVWLGVSVEDQKAADERVPLLLKTPAAVRWVSAEPLLEAIDIGDGLDWAVVGGESGPRARPFNLGWARDLIDQCRADGVPIFVKQLGAVPVVYNANEWDFPLDGHGGALLFEHGQGAASARVKFRSPKGGDPAEWPEELRVREYPQLAA